ncbi:GAF and ANTAR domain-containing protein [Arthrobacter sp. HMWF013]|uniref:GAF and ANTAR domain-containing protein n=1 Tax=Arthrobacter sp. HMWF013 TaxID=2056849 RepID=UPI000D3BBF92|nr:GAF and ANTAR domain-containing protein [Arthrobacter sp. HMWF013]PTT58927.1 response regulator receiver protein [Arthrobacter sp. HMWF013]
MSDNVEIRESLAGGVDEAGTGLQDFVLLLQDLVLESSDVRNFLTEMATTIAGQLSQDGNRISCGMTVIRHKRPVAVASSDPRAQSLDELQNSFGDGPCLTALRSGTPVYVPDTNSDKRWPKYLRAAGAARIGSILAVPMHLQNQAQAVVNLYSPAAHGFSQQGIDEAENLAGISAKALDLALNIAHLRDARDDLTAALKSRTVIDTAIGAIMAQNRCSRDAAFQILVKTSSHRNIKLREVASAIISSIAGEEDISTTYEE